MSFVFNCSKGKVNEYVNRVANQDPTTSRLVVVAINTTATEAVLKDLATLAAVLANGNTVEAGNTGYARIVFNNTNVSVTVDNPNDKQVADMDDLDFGNIDGDDVNWTDLLVCYADDQAGGTDADVVPMTCHDYVKTPNGLPILAVVNGFFEATEPA